MFSRGRERDALETNGLTYLIFSPDFFGHVGKRLNKEVKVTLKIYNFIYWETNNYNTHIAQYLKKWQKQRPEVFCK